MLIYIYIDNIQQKCKICTFMQTIFHNLYKNMPSTLKMLGRLYH